MSTVAFPEGEDPRDREMEELKKNKLTPQELHDFFQDYEPKSKLGKFLQVLSAIISGDDERWANVARPDDFPRDPRLDPNSPEFGMISERDSPAVIAYHQAIAERLKNYPELEAEFRQRYEEKYGVSDGFDYDKELQRIREAQGVNAVALVAPDGTGKEWTAGNNADAGADNLVERFTIHHDRHGNEYQITDTGGDPVCISTGTESHWYMIKPGPDGPIYEEVEAPPQNYPTHMTLEAREEDLVYRQRINADGNVIREPDKIVEPVYRQRIDADGNIIDSTRTVEPVYRQRIGDDGAVIREPLEGRIDGMLATLSFDGDANRNDLADVAQYKIGPDGQRQMVGVNQGDPTDVARYTVDSNGQRQMVGANQGDPTDVARYTVDSNGQRQMVGANPDILERGGSAMGSLLEQANFSSPSWAGAHQGAIDDKEGQGCRVVNESAKGCAITL